MPARSHDREVLKYSVLLGRKRVAPLIIGLVDGVLCVGFHLIRSRAGAAQAAERGTRPERDPGDEKELPAAGHVDSCTSRCALD